MHYYQHHIGDFIRDTSRLSDSQAMAYLRLLWMYYDTESPLPDTPAVLALKVGCDVESVTLLLGAFFALQDGHWHHGRCDKEIADYHAYIESQRAKGALGGRPRKTHGKPAALPEETHGKPGVNPNQQPLTNNHKPIDTVSNDTVGAKAPRAKRGARLPEDWRLPKGWGDWALAEFTHWTADVVRLEADKFADHWRAKSGKDAAKLDWEATWRNWCRSDIAQRSHHPSSTNKNGQSLNKQEALEARNREVVARMLAKENTHEAS